MNIYVETNFILELALLQEETESCERILSLCENRQAKLVIPAYSLAEPNETLKRRENSRENLFKEVDKELNQLARSIPYQTETATLRALISLLTRSGAEQRQRFVTIRERLLQTAEIVPLSAEALSSAATYEIRHGFSPQDAIVFTSVLQHLRTSSSDTSCFINRNPRDFDDPDIRDVLMNHKCKLLFTFTDGYSYVRSQI